MIMTEDILNLPTCQGDEFYSVKSDFTRDYTKTNPPSEHTVKR